MFFFSLFSTFEGGEEVDFHACILDTLSLLEEKKNVETFFHIGGVGMPNLVRF